MEALFAILATWCFARLEFHPPKAGESVDVVLYTPVSAIGEFVHLVPADGVEADGWIRTVEPDIPATNKPPANGISVWKVRAAGGTYPLVFRIGETTVTHEFRAGQTVYTEALRHHSDGYATQLRMREARFFGVVPGIPQIGLTPWLVAYLLIVCAAFPVIRKVTGIL